MRDLDAIIAGNKTTQAELEAARVPIKLDLDHFREAEAPGNGPHDSMPYLDAVIGGLLVMARRLSR